jgi:cytochrome c oxidase subunit IV
VTDEASSLLRIAAFGVVAAIAYGFLTQEYLGTWGLIALSLGPGYAGLLIYYESRRRAPETESLVHAFRRFAGLPEPDPKRDEELAADDLAVIPRPSIWPFMCSVGLAVLLTGLIFGSWLVLLGGAVVAWGLWGWISAVNRETAAAERARTQAAKPATPSGR